MIRPDDDVETHSELYTLIVRTLDITPQDANSWSMQCIITPQGSNYALYIIVYSNQSAFSIRGI